MGHFPAPKEVPPGRTFARPQGPPKLPQKRPEMEQREQDVAEEDCPEEDAAEEDVAACPGTIALPGDTTTVLFMG